MAAVGEDELRAEIAELKGRREALDAEYAGKRFPDEVRDQFNVIADQIIHKEKMLSELVGREELLAASAEKPDNVEHMNITQFPRPGVSGMPVDVEIHPGDDMFGGNLDAYLAVGRSALHVIESTLSAVGCDSPKAILDLPCGHGRVLRHLRHRWPDTRIVCCDLDRSGVDFCAAHFNAEPVYSRTDPAEIPINDRFDLIWVGSLFTHFDKPLWREFLRFFFDRLTTDGLLIFTTHGRFDANRDTAIGSAAWDFARVGFGYYEPADRPGYGLSYASPAWVFRLLSEHPGRLVTYWERGWNDHQDVVAVSAVRYDASWRRPN